MVTLNVQEQKGFIEVGVFGHRAKDTVMKTSLIVFERIKARNLNGQN